MRDGKWNCKDYTENPYYFSLCIFNVFSIGLNCTYVRKKTLQCRRRCPLYMSGHRSVHVVTVAQLIMSAQPSFDSCSQLGVSIRLLHIRMATWNSEDEFDQMPDDIDFAAIEEDEWNAIQTQNSSTSVQFNVHAIDISANSRPPISYEGHRIVGTPSADITGICIYPSPSRSIRPDG